MGYLQLASLPAHNKAVIAFWLRIPAASLAAALAQAADSTVPFAKKIPLLCWGERASRIQYDLGTVDIMNWQNPTDPAGDLFANTWTNPHSVGDLGPSYVAIRFSGVTPYLEVHIQTNTTPTIVGHTYAADSLTAWSDGNGPHDFTEGNGNVNLGGSISGHTTGITDQSYVLAATAARFDFSNSSITGDEWIQVTISYDISTGAATHQVTYPNAFPVNTAAQTTANARAWFAVNDANITMATASENWVDGGGDNDIIPDEALTIALQSHTQRTYFNLFTSTATYTLTDPTVGAGAVGVPASSVYVANILKVEMAELQIFTGVTADTSLEDTRRAFITADGTPANMALAQTLLGQAPDIKLHGSNNWKLGLNTGSSGDPFDTVGAITTYSTAPDITP